MRCVSFQILRDVAEAFGVSLELLRAPGRVGGAKLFDARCVAARRLRNERGLTLNQIAGYLGGRDHTSIIRMVDETYRQRHMARHRPWYEKKHAARRLKQQDRVDRIT